MKCILYVQERNSASGLCVPKAPRAHSTAGKPVVPTTQADCYQSILPVSLPGVEDVATGVRELKARIGLMIVRGQDHPSCLGFS